MLPEEVIRQAQQDIWSIFDTGIGVMEHSHRGPSYDAVHREALALLTELLGVPETHHVLLLQGGARQQFAMIPSRSPA